MPDSPAAPTPQTTEPPAAVPAPQTADPNTEPEIVLDIEASDLDESASGATGAKDLIAINPLVVVNDWLIDISKISIKDKLLFFELLSSLFESGLPVPEILKLLSDQIPNPKLRKVSLNIRKLMGEGASLSEAMGKHADVFDDSICSVIEAGEKSGRITEVLKQLVEQLSRRADITDKVHGVMTYPIIVGTFMVILTTVVLMVVVPKFESIFAQSGGQLPLPTRILVAGSELLIGYWWAILVSVIGMGVLFKIWKNSRVGKKIWERLIMMIPIVGPIVHNLLLSRITRTMAFLLASQVDLVESTKIASRVADNRNAREMLLLSADDLTKGINLSESMADNPLFPPMLISMLSIGEKSASLAQTCDRAANYYENELNRKISQLSKMLEPIIIAVVSSIAIFLILAIYLPVLKLNDNVMG